jgi:anthranilate synthase component II
MRILVLDNYDSFTYNLVHIIRELEVDHEVHRNDQIAVDEVARFDAIVLSPGPGIPSEAGIMPELIQVYAPKKPIFGICLGHQALAEYMGATLRNMDTVFHGVHSTIRHTKDSPLFKGIPPEFQAGRYHSWVVEKDNLPSAICVTAVDEDNSIMAIQHEHLPLFGVQFHPESIMTEYGKEMVENFIRIAMNSRA